MQCYANANGSLKPTLGKLQRPNGRVKPLPKAAAQPRHSGESVANATRRGAGNIVRATCSGRQQICLRNCYRKSTTCNFAVHR